MDPMSQLVPTAQRERALPLSSHTDPHIYNPTPSAAETSLRLWACASPSPYPCPHAALSQCGHFTAVRTAPVLLSPHHGLSRGRERWEGGERRHLRCCPQSGDHWNPDRSICHALIPHTHLLSEGLTWSFQLCHSLPLSLAAPSDATVGSSWTPPLEIFHNLHIFFTFTATNPPIRTFDLSLWLHFPVALLSISQTRWIVASRKGKDANPRVGHTHKTHTLKDTITHRSPEKVPFRWSRLGNQTFLEKLNYSYLNIILTSIFSYMSQKQIYQSILYVAKVILTVQF